MCVCVCVCVCAYIYERGPKNSHDDILSADNDFFNQWDPNIAIHVHCKWEYVKK